ncbi:MAG: ChaN family lipoprotein [Desulfobacterales bacterium]|nr:ChaN family lipoprotein [Desulfobacterales bacterium]
MPELAAAAVLYALIVLSRRWSCTLPDCLFSRHLCFLRSLPWQLPAATAFAAAERTRPACSPAPGPRLDADGVRPGAPPAPLVAAMAQREAVLLGEQHDDADHHRWQLQMLAALHAQRPNMVIGFEMFPRRVQPALDRWVAGELHDAAVPGAGGVGQGVEHAGRAVPAPVPVRAHQPHSAWWR